MKASNFFENYWTKRNESIENRERHRKDDIVPMRSSLLPWTIEFNRLKKWIMGLDLLNVSNAMLSEQIKTLLFFFFSLDLEFVLERDLHHQNDHLTTEKDYEETREPKSMMMVIERDIETISSRSRSSNRSWLTKQSLIHHYRINEQRNQSIGWWQSEQQIDCCRFESFFSSRWWWQCNDGMYS